MCTKILYFFSLIYLLFINLFRVKPANFEIEWTIEDDTKLLKGIYKHGMGSWEAIKMDESLKLGDKILLNGSKAQIKKIQARGEYLLKILKKQMDQKLGVVRFYTNFIPYKSKYWLNNCFASFPIHIFFRATIVYPILPLTLYPRYI